jgi:glyoxylase-like metal-dependent hydrolase (beta-lactamase superfamily II)
MNKLTLLSWIVKSFLFLTVFTLSSAVNATASQFTYKAASPTVAAINLQKVEGGHLERFTKPFEIQRLSDNVYWVSVAYYNVTVLVGKESVLLIDAPIGRGKQILEAIKTITNKPLSAIVYSHAHSDHIGDAGVILRELGNNDIDLYATEEVRDELVAHKMGMPAPTKTVSDGINFEGHYLKVNNTLVGHTPDNTTFLIEDGDRKILHAVDIVHPDQLEFRNFSLAQDPIIFQNDLVTLMSMDWDVMVTGHNNLGYKEDVKFIQDYIADIREYLGTGFSKFDFSDHIKGNLPYAWFDGYKVAVIDFAHELLARKYRTGREQEFDIVGKTHVEAFYWAMFTR